MGEKGNQGWKMATLVCALLLVVAVVAIIVLAVGSGDESGDALEEQVQVLEDQVDDLTEEIDLIESEPVEPETDTGEAESVEPSDRDKLEALGEAMAGDDFYVSEIVIDGDWARVSIAPNEPMSAQGELCYYHKIGGEWTCVDCGTGLQYGDIPGAPASIFP